MPSQLIKSGKSPTYSTVALTFAMLIGEGSEGTAQFPSKYDPLSFKSISYGLYPKTYHTFTGDPIKYYHILNRLKLFKEFENNWNGYDAEPISREVIKKSHMFADILGDKISKFDVFPTAQNSIQFESEFKNKYIEIEIFDFKYELFFEIENVENEIVFTDLQLLSNKIDELYG